MLDIPRRINNVPGVRPVLRYVLATLVLAAVLIGAPATMRAAEQTTLSVFAAASLGDVFKTVGQEFEKVHPDVHVAFNFAGSQQLVQQLADGAPADLFASADDKQMQKAVAAGRIDGATIKRFAGNRLIVVIPEDNPAGLTTLADLRRQGLNILMAEENVPAGRYTRQVLSKIDSVGVLGNDYGKAVLASVSSFEENVRAVASKVMLGDADAGFVYATDAGTGMRIGRIVIPDSLNIIAHYPIGLIKDSSQKAAAKLFADFLVSPEGQAIFAKAGFLPAPAAAKPHHKPTGQK